MLEPVRPRYLWVPPGGRGSYLDEVADVANLMGRPLDAAQRIAVEALTTYGDKGNWLTLESAVKMGRQSGKTGGIVTPIVMTDLFLWEPDRIAWSAHLFKTSRDAFADHCRLIESTPEFDRRVAKISYANGEEAITLKNGASLEYLARSKRGGRGLGGKRTVIDEALFFSVEQAGALLPILAARSMTGCPQVMYASSGATVESDQLRALTARGRAHDDPSLIWVEYCAPGSWDEPGCVNPRCDHSLASEGCALDNEALWPAANPALGVRIDVGFLRGMRRTLATDPREFAREFLGWDDVPLGGGLLAISAPAWLDCLDETSQPVGSVAFGIFVTPDRAVATIGSVGRRADGLLHIEIVDERRGTSWVVERVKDLLAHDPVAVVIEPGSAAGSLVTDLETAEIDVTLITGAEAAQATGVLYDAVIESSVRHIGQEQLTSAVTNASLRTTLRGGSRWHPIGPEHIAGLDAVTCALHGFVTSGEAAPWVFAE